VKKHLIPIGIIIIFLIIFIPLASTSPDGLEKAAGTVGANKQVSLWEGLMSGYSIEGIGNRYVSTLLAGVFGIFIVLLASLILGKAVTNREPAVFEKTT
jgi:hypothetical protein